MVSFASLNRFLKKHPRVGLDSNILIYFIEAAPQYNKHCRKIFESIESGKNTGVCATLTLLEILVQPYRKKQNELVNQFYGLLTTYPNLIWEDLSLPVADLGAKIRAEYNIKTPDAILLATAIHHNATGFIGNDSQLKKVKALDVFILGG